MQRGRNMNFYMNKDKALESVNEIKELMEKSSKFISVSEHINWLVGTATSGFGMCLTMMIIFKLKKYRTAEVQAV